MSETPGFRTLLTLAWPIVLARSAQSVIGFCDAAMVAPLGEDALAAATTGAMNAMGLFALPLGTVFIVQSYAAQLGGAGDLEGARRYAWYGLLLAAITTGLGVLGIPFVDLLLGLTGHAPAVREAMADYMQIRLLSVGVVIGTEALGAWFGGLGDTRVAMRASLVAMVVNVALNWVLIDGNLGAPALGVQGAAWASVAASAAGFGVAALAFARSRGRRDLGRIGAPAEGPPLPLVEAPGSGRLRLAELARMLRFGLPNGFTWFLEFAAFLAFVNFIVADIGTVAVAALMTVVAVNSVSFMPAFGLSSAGAVLVGQAIGAGRRDDVPPILLRTFATVATWQGLVGVLYFAAPAALMSIFAREEVASAGAVVALGTTLLAISAAWQLLDAAVMSVSEALRAAGDTQWPLWARILLAWFVWLPLSYYVVFVAGGGAVGATWSMVVYFAALSVCLVLRFRGGAWRSIDLTGHSAP